MFEMSKFCRKDGQNPQTALLLHVVSANREPSHGELPSLQSPGYTESRECGVNTLASARRNGAACPRVADSALAACLGLSPTTICTTHLRLDMSLQGLVSGAECAVPFNPLSQVLKHTEGDRSLQQVGLACSGVAVSV